MARAPADLLVLDHAYQLTLWTCQRVCSFPRMYRHNLGEKLLLQLDHIHELLIQARYQRDRANLLRTVNMQLHLLRLRFRLAKDLRCLPLKSYEHASRAVNEIGQMVGGWLRRSTQRQDGPPPQEAA